MNIFIIIGILINVGCNVINRFVWEIPNRIAIPLYLIGIACFVVGFVVMKQSGVADPILKN